MIVVWASPLAEWAAQLATPRDVGDVYADKQVYWSNFQLLVQMASQPAMSCSQLEDYTLAVSWQFIVFTIPPLPNLLLHLFPIIFHVAMMLSSPPLLTVCLAQ